MTHVRTVDHIAVAVSSIAAALPLYQDILGGRFVMGGDDDDRGLRTLQLELPNLKLELMEPLRPDSDVQAFLDRRGPGFHHMTIFVEDVEQTVADLEAQGFEVVDLNLTSSRWRETYVRPRSGFGALLQIVDTDARWDVPSDTVTLEDVLAGRAEWRDHRPQLRLGRESSTEER
jgi:methylmalonyl-CoA/ethylmalonyl-CoA epimerase